MKWIFLSWIVFPLFCCTNFVSGFFNHLYIKKSGFFAFICDSSSILQFLFNTAAQWPLKLKKDHVAPLLRKTSMASLKRICKALLLSIWFSYWYLQLIEASLFCCYMISFWNNSYVLQRMCILGEVGSTWPSREILSSPPPMNAPKLQPHIEQLSLRMT